MSVSPDLEFVSIRYSSYTGYSAVILLGELYFVTSEVTIGAITAL